MPVEAHVHGHQGFDKLAAAFHKGADEWDRELDRGLNNAGEVVAEAIRSGPKPFMPEGYEEVFAASMVTKVSVVRRGMTRMATIAVRAFGRKGHPRQVEQLEKGRLKHPVFTRAVWAWQKIRPGFVTIPARRAAPEATREIDKAVEKVTDKIERAL